MTQLAYSASVGNRGRQHNPDIFDFEAHNLHLALHLLIWSARTLRALYSHPFRYGAFHAGTERIEYANFLSVETLVTDHTRLQSVTRILILDPVSNASPWPNHPLTALPSLIHPLFCLQEPPQLSGLSDLLQRGQNRPSPARIHRKRPVESWSSDRSHRFKTPTYKAQGRTSRILQRSSLLPR
jgi:hypothetical protein